MLIQLHSINLPDFNRKINDMIKPYIPINHAY